MPIFGHGNFFFTQTLEKLEPYWKQFNSNFFLPEENNNQICIVVPQISYGPSMTIQDIWVRSWQWGKSYQRKRCHFTRLGNTGNNFYRIITSSSNNILGHNFVNFTNKLINITMLFCVHYFKRILRVIEDWLVKFTLFGLLKADNDDVELGCHTKKSSHFGM